jgi:hypothetical protein
MAMWTWLPLTRLAPSWPARWLLAGVLCKGRGSRLPALGAARRSLLSRNTWRRSFVREACQRAPCGYQEQVVVRQGKLQPACTA